MTGSAASLPRHERGAPLSLFQPVQQHGQPAPMAWRSPPGRVPCPAAAMGPPRTRVLLLANQALIAFELQRALREAGYRIVGPASSAEQARRLLARCSIDCAIVDFDNLDARAVSESAELLERWSIPFVVLTGRTELPAPQAGRPHLQKPFDPEDVVAAVERAIAAQLDDGGIQYPVAPPALSWPRIMPQL
jgi:CheY-like chemotaxis protein